MATTKTKQLTMDDITRIVMLKTCGDPHTLAQIMLASATDGECCRELLDFCKQEGIDPLPAMAIAMRPSLLEMKIGGTICGGSEIRTPFSFEEE